MYKILCTLKLYLAISVLSFCSSVQADDVPVGGVTPQPPVLECWIYQGFTTCRQGFINAGVNPPVDFECGPCYLLPNKKWACTVPIRRNIYEESLEHQAPFAIKLESGRGQNDLGESLVYCGEGNYCATECEVTDGTSNAKCMKTVDFKSVLPFRRLHGLCEVGVTSEVTPTPLPTTKLRSGE